MARHIFLPPLSVHRHRLHPLGVCGFESFQTLHPRKRAARPDSRPPHELCRHTRPKNFPKIRHPLCRHGTQQHHHARSDPSPPMAADGKSSGARLRTARCQPPFRTRPATQIRLRMAVPPPTYWAEYSTDRLNKEKKTTNRISCSAPSRTFAVSKDTMSYSLPLPGRWHNARNCA